MRINQRRFMLVDYFNLCVIHFRHLDGHSSISHDDWQDLLTLVPLKTLSDYMSSFQTKIATEKAIQDNLDEALILQGLDTQQDYRPYWDSIVVLMTQQKKVKEGQLAESEYQEEIEAILRDKTLA